MESHAADERRQVTPPASGPTGARRLVLIVDDDPEIRETIQWTLEDEGLAVQTAGDGQQALERVEAQRPALILLDMGLPGMSGEEVVERLRAGSDEVPRIVVLSADGRGAERAQRLGALAYVDKPFDLDELASTVHRCLDAA